MKKHLIVKQDGFKECGAASLLSIIRYYGGNISINKLVELTHTDKTGTNFYNLKVAARELGLDSIGYEFKEIDNLKEIDKPFVCQLVDHNYEHFVVIYSIKKSKIIMMDPACGERILSLEEFKNLTTGYILVFSPIKKLLFYEEKKYLNKVIMETISKNKSIVYNILSFSIIYTLFSCFSALYLQSTLDNINNYALNNIIILTFIFGIIILIKCISNFFRNELLIYLSQKIDCSIFLNAFQKLVLLPYSYYKNRTVGEITSRINDLIVIKNMINQIIITVFLDVIIFLISGVILFIINPLLLLFLLIIIALYLLILYVFRPTLKHYTNKTQEHNAKIESFLIESINAYETTKNMSNELKIIDKMATIYTNALNDNFIYNNISNLELFIKDIVYYIGMILIEFIGLCFVLNNKLSIGSLFTFILLSNYFIDSIKNIIDLNKDYYYAINAIKRVNNLLDIEQEDISTKTSYIMDGTIKLNNLTFSYNNDINILKNINLEIKRAEKVIFLGNSGSGKSTIIKLLLKYYFPTRDMVYLNGIDINDLTIYDVRNNISCISQNEILFNDTIKNNIIMDRNIDDNLFLNVCKLTYVDEFASKMFLGYDTRLEENGLNLSGGQRQRIILARALLKPNKIILIDEGLNAVDINLERKILKNIFNVYRNRTIIVVSHRLENIDLFDKVITLDSGMIKEELKYPERDLYD